MKQQKSKVSYKQVILFVIGALVGLILGFLVFRPLFVDDPGKLEFPDPKPTISSIVHSSSLGI